MNIPRSKNTGESDHKHMNISRSKNTKGSIKCHEINVKYFPSPANEMQFSDRQQPRFGSCPFDESNESVESTMLDRRVCCQ